MIIQGNRILWSAEFAGFKFSEVFLSKKKEIAFKSKIRGKSTIITISKLSTTVHQLLEELAGTNIVVAESDIQAFLQANTPHLQTPTKNKESSTPQAGIIYSAQYQDLHTFCTILDRLLAIAETHDFSEITVTENDPKLAREEPTAIAFLATPKSKVKPTHGKASSTTEAPQASSPKNPKPNGWLQDAALAFAIKNNLPPRVTVPPAVIEEFLESLPKYQKTTFKSARTIFANLKYKRPQKRND